MKKFFEKEIQKRERVEKQEDYEGKYIDAKPYVACGAKAMPRLSFVEGWEKYEGKSPSSKMQFDEIRQNNGRIYDFIPVGVRE